jgi:hypothetical protein
MPIKRFVFLSVLVCPLWACAPVNSAPTTSGIEAFRRVDGQKAVGRAQWLFQSPLDGLSSATHYVLEALFLKNNGEVVLHSHFNGFEWRDGVRIGFRRDGSHLGVSVQVPGQSPQSASLPDSFLSRDGHFKVRVEVHNSELSGVRVLIWGYNLSLQGEVQNPRRFLSAANADFDTRALGWIFYAHGRGAHWGVEFENARVLTAFREAPYVP